MDNSQQSTTFYDIFSFLCAVKEVSITAAAAEIDISTGTIANWKGGTIPYDSTMRKVCDYFNVEFGVVKNIIEGLNWQEESVRKNYNDNWKKLLVAYFPGKNIEEPASNIMFITELEKVKIQNYINEIRLKLNEIEKMLNK